MKNPDICIVLGNGPSLSSVSNDILNEFYTFGSNGIYKKYTPDFYFCVNPAEFERRKEDIRNLETMKFLSASFNEPCDVPLFFNFSGFSYHPLWNVCQGHTVTFVCLQFAFYYNFKTVILLGIDHRYRDYKGFPDEVIKWEGSDTNHFSKDYLAEGDQWFCPNLEASESYYKLALEAFNAHGRDIFNLTKNSALNIFPRKDPDELRDFLG